MVFLRLPPFVAGGTVGTVLSCARQVKVTFLQTGGLFAQHAPELLATPTRLGKGMLRECTSIREQLTSQRAVKKGEGAREEEGAEGAEGGSRERQVGTFSLFIRGS